MLVKNGHFIRRSTYLLHTYWDITQYTLLEEKKFRIKVVEELVTEEIFYVQCSFR